MGRAKSDTYSSLFTKSDNVNLDETFDQKSVFVHVLTYSTNYHNRYILQQKKQRKTYRIKPHHQNPPAKTTRQNLPGQNPFAKPPSEKFYCYQIHLTNYPG